MAYSELLWRASVCGRLMHLSVDPSRKRRFKELRDAWIALAHDDPETIAAFVESEGASIH